MRIFAGGVVVALGLTIAGCATSSSSNPPAPPDPPSPNIAFSAPQNGATIYGTPVTVSITTANLSDASQLSVRLNGTDITSTLSAPDANGVRTVQISPPAISYGKNQLQARYQSLLVNTSFTLNTVSAIGSPDPNPGAVDPSTQLAGITTRVLAPGTKGTKATNWGIQITTSSGPQSYWAPPPQDQNGNPCSGDCSYGYQILMLNRQDLSLVTNYSYEVANAAEIGGNSAFLQALEYAGSGPNDVRDGVVTNPNPKNNPWAACKPNGCIMVMQSLAQIGFAPCYTTSEEGTCPAFVDDSSTVNLAYWLTKLGSTAQVLFANGMQSSHVGYSFIGNAGSGTMPGTGAIGARDGQGNIIVTTAPNTGAQFERLGCIDTRYQNSNTICDNLGNAGSSYNSGGSTDVQQAGRISGVLVRDNFNLFTFSQNMRQIAYTFGTTVSQGGSPTAGGTYTSLITIDGQGPNSDYGYYPNTITLGGGPGQGAIRLLMLERTHPDWDKSITVRIDKFYKCCGYDAELQQLQTDISNIHDADDIIFLSTVGDIQHDNWSPFASAWVLFVQAAQQLGGDPITARILGDKYPAFNPDSKDDYLLVGKIVANSPPYVDQFTAGKQSRFTAQESGYVINRHTIANAPYPTQVEGLLVPDHQGYYTPHMQGLKTGIMVPQVASLASASLQLPSVWPYSSADTTASAGEKAAYTWISGQLCICSDIRSTYTNLNVSPTSWAVQLDQLTYPTDQSSNFSGAEFDTVTKHLALEFSYVADTRSLLNNVLSLYQSEQSNVGLILTQAFSDINSQLDLTTPPPPTHTPWSVFTSDVFPVLTTLAEFAGPEAEVGGQFAIAGFDNALGIGTVVIDNATDRTNDTTGVSQLMQALSNENIAAASLAQHEADQYADSLASLGNDFKRVVTNWSSLNAIGAPIESGQISWDPLATSFYLRAFDLATRRQFFPQLMNGSKNYFITHIYYADYQYYGSDTHYVDTHGNGCSIETFHSAQDNLQNPGYYVDDNGNLQDMRGTAWWPGFLQTRSGSGNYPNDYWWDIWALGQYGNTDDNCPNYRHNLPNTFNMFDPIDFNNPQSSGLGLWKPYIFQYAGFPSIGHSNANFPNVP